MAVVAGRAKGGSVAERMIEANGVELWVDWETVVGAIVEHTASNRAG